MILFIIVSIPYQLTNLQHKKFPNTLVEYFTDIKFTYISTCIYVYTPEIVQNNLVHHIVK